MTQVKLQIAYLQYVIHISVHNILLLEIYNTTVEKEIQKSSAVKQFIFNTDLFSS